MILTRQVPLIDETRHIRKPIWGSSIIQLYKNMYTLWVPMSIWMESNTKHCYDTQFKTENKYYEQCDRKAVWSMFKAQS